MPHLTFLFLSQESLWLSLAIHHCPLTVVQVSWFDLSNKINTPLMWKLDTTMWWRQTGSSRVNCETRGSFDVRNARQHGKQKVFGEEGWNACMHIYCICLCVCLCVRERARQRERKKKGISVSVWMREELDLCMCTHETHFTQHSTYIFHPADEVSEKVAVLWQIKSSSCKASINLAFPLEWNVFVLGGNCPQQ